MTPKTFTEFDKLELKPFAERLTSFIHTDRDFLEGALILSLNGSFGCGKSTFFEMWRQLLETEDPQRFSTIHLNAWDADFLHDALLSIVSGFAAHFKLVDPKLDTEELKSKAGKIGKMAMSLGNDIVKKASGMDIQKAGKAAEPRKPGLMGKACFEVFEDRKKTFKELKEMLEKFVNDSPLPIIVMVDELDRCRPDYAVEYLEVIKHIFDIPHLVFVLGVDKTNLASSVRAMFGESLNFDEYYRKFAHRNIDFPNIQPHSYGTLCEALYTQYISSKILQKSGRFSYRRSESYKTSNLQELCQEFKIGPRQLHEAYRLQAHLLRRSKESNNTMKWTWEIGTIFMTLLSVSETTLYHAIGQRTLSGVDFVQFLRDRSVIVKEKGKLWWGQVLYFGIFSQENYSIEQFRSDLVEGTLLDNKITPEDWKQDASGLGRYFDDRDTWDKPLFVEIYEFTEEVKRFAS